MQGSFGPQITQQRVALIVVGYFWDPTGRSHGFRMRNGQFARIDGPDATRTAVLGINNSNAVVGYYMLSSGAQTGFEKKEGGNLWAYGSELTGINDFDAKIGFVLYGSGAVAFHPQGQYTLDLRLSRCDLDSAAWNQQRRRNRGHLHRLAKYRARLHA